MKIIFGLLLSGILFSCSGSDGEPIKTPTELIPGGSIFDAWITPEEDKLLQLSSAEFSQPINIPMSYSSKELNLPPVPFGFEVVESIPDPVCQCDVTLEGADVQGNYQVQNCENDDFVEGDIKFRFSTIPKIDACTTVYKTGIYTVSDNKLYWADDATGVVLLFRNSTYY